MVLIFLMLAAGPAQASPEPVPRAVRGDITDPVRCGADPRFSYALYLPPAYSPEKKWPILYVLDPRGRGRLAAELFREVAARRGFIVASSNDTESDNPEAPNDRAISALLEDTHGRLSIDERRVYASGFSGGARMACGVGYGLKRGVAGVIGCGAGFPSTQPPRRELPFAYFGAAGMRDFNYYEMRTLEKDLVRLAARARVVFFDGEHEWFPPELAGEAVEWLELQAMKEGRIPREDALVQRLWEKDLAAARALEQEGDAAGAFARYGAAARDLAGLVDVSPAEAARARLRKEGVEKEASRREKRDAADQSANDTALETLGKIKSADAPPLLLGLLGELRIAELRKQAARAPTYEAASAQRRLNYVFAHAAFYLPRELGGRGEHLRAALSLSVAAEIRPESPAVWYRLAQSWAKAGSKTRAIDALERAVENGFKDAARLESDPDLEPLRGEAGFGSLLEKIRAKAGPPR
jgi:predicted esterase